MKNSCCFIMINFDWENYLLSQNLWVKKPKKSKAIQLNSNIFTILNLKRKKIWVLIIG